jgi:hypothetical protein
VAELCCRKPKLPESVREFFRRKGREGGKLGGPVGGVKRWEGVSAEERSAHARKVVAAREAKRRAKKKGR